MWRRVVRFAIVMLVATSLSFVATTPVTAQDDGARITTADDTGAGATSLHGSACQPANLGQSINLQTSWAQYGIRNVNPLGSGRNFYVVCPISVHDELGSLSQYLDVYLHIEYPKRDATNRVSCTVYYQYDIEPGFVNTVTVVDTTTAGASNSSLATGLYVDDVGVENFFGGYYSAVAVCKLVPQSEIAGLVAVTSTTSFPHSIDP